MASIPDVADFISSGPVQVSYPNYYWPQSGKILFEC